MKIVVSGGSGFIGSALIGRLTEDGHDVVLLTRNPERARSVVPASVVLAGWDGRGGGAWTSHVDGCDAVINLTGESVAARRWSAEQKRRILSSRIEPTRAIVDAIRGAARKPSVLISASGIGFYGALEDMDATEECPRGAGFMAEVTELWEGEAIRAEEPGVRVAMLRMGLVLHREGGALQRLVTPFRLFVGGPIGHGAQWFPWIHRNDLFSVISFVLAHPSLTGPVNVVAPESVTMRQFCSALGSVLHRPCWLPVPAFLLRIVLGEMSEMLLTGQKALPKKLLDAGFSFRFPSAGAALLDILG